MAAESETELMRQPAAIEVQNYSYRYPFTEGWAVHDIGFSVSPGDTVAVFGDSGSGKSTLFSSLIGLNHHFYRGGLHEGSIGIFGQDVATGDIMQLTAKYGLVTQDFRNQLLVSQVADAIAFPLENRSVPLPEMQERVRGLVALLGIEGLANRGVGELSGGEGQAVVVASMLAKRPDIMVFDDVASDLDPRAQLRMREIIHVLRSQGMTMMIVDSSAPAWLLEEVADQVVYLDGGRQVYAGNPDGFSAHPQWMTDTGVRVSSSGFREGMNSPQAVTGEHISYAYGSHLAVDDVSCSITQGSITGIIGHNGSGKTTLLKVLAGLYAPDEGTVTIDGMDPRKSSAKDAVRHVAYMPQNMNGIFFTDSVAAELAYTPIAAGLSQVITADMLGLTGFENSHPEFLSAGQRQRLALGCALSSDPNVLLLDEPTKGLNQKERQLLTLKLIELQQAGKTVVLVSHDWPFIARTANNLIVMDHGKIIRQGASGTVLTDRVLFDGIGMPLPW